MVRDSAGNHDGRIHGASWTEEGKYGSALEFDGEEDIVTIPASSELNFTEGFTLEAWVDPSEAHNWASLIAKEDSGEGLPFGYLLYAQGGGEVPAAYVAEDDFGYHNMAGETPLPLNTWTHLAWTPMAKKCASTSTANLTTPKPRLRSRSPTAPCKSVATKSSASTSPVASTRSSCMAKLGGSEIEADMKTAIEPAPAPEPVAAYSFDEGSSEMVRDSAGNHDGRNHGAKWAEGKYGGALEFDGKEDHVTIPSSEALNFSEGFTLEAWVDPSEAKEWTTLIARDDPEEALPYSYILYAEGEGPPPPSSAKAAPNTRASTAKKRCL
jgi:hypothetical protein